MALIERLKELELEASRLLGDAYQPLVEQRTRGLDSANAPRSPHRLVDAIRRVAASHYNLERGVGLIDAEAIVEVSAVLDYSREWLKDPNWPALQKSLCNEDYAHAVILMAAFRLYSRAGNLVVLKGQEPARRTFDLEVLSKGFTMAIEVKAPAKLRRGGQDPLPTDVARTIIAEAMKSAGTAENGQLGPRYCGVLVVGGFGLKKLDLDRLASGAKSLFSSKTLSHIAAIQILSIGAHITNGTITKNGVEGGQGSTLEPRIGVRLVKNPRYLGVVKLTALPPSAEELQILNASREVDLQQAPTLRRFR